MKKTLRGWGGRGKTALWTNLVQNPELNTLGREKIIRIHDHGREKRHAHTHKVKVTEVTIKLDDGSQTIKHVLASSHYMLT